MYEAIDISFGTRNRHILKGVSITIKPGQFTAVVGPNGAGKSSLLKIISNEQRADSGIVRVNGKTVDRYTARELARIRAVMAQHSSVHFPFSAREVIALSRHGHDTSRNENQRIIEEVSDITGIAHLGDQNYVTLSGGEKQRVQLARVLAQVWQETVYPRYILLDEPTSSMDIAQQQLMFSIVKNACARNIGVLAIVHDLNLAAQYADNIGMLRGGELVSAGPAVDVFTKHNIEKTFCCKVSVYHDPCSRCPFIVPESEPSPITQLAMTK